MLGFYAELLYLFLSTDSCGVSGIVTSMADTMQAHGNSNKLQFQPIVESI